MSATDDRHAAPKDSVWHMVRRVTPMSLLLPLLGTGVSYAAYANDLSDSGWPWKFALLVTLTCFFSPFMIYMKYRRTNLLWVCGLVQSIGIFAVYFFFGIFAYFYYFIFAPLQPLVKWLGLLGGVVLTIYWLASIKRSVLHTIAATSFVERKELAEASTLNRTEKEIKLDASIVSIGTTLIQGVGNGLKAYGEAGPKGVYWTEFGEAVGPYVEYAGRFVGALAGLVGAIYDFKEARDNLEHNNLALAFLYGSSVIANFAFAIATMLGATVFVFIFMILVMVIGLIILWTKKDKIGEWLEKCYFGTSDEKFSESDEHRQFELLTQG